eukprot:5206440-Pyramimonas_sp.AAC.1
MRWARHSTCRTWPRYGTDRSPAGTCCICPRTRWWLPMISGNPLAAMALSLARRGVARAGWVIIVGNQLMKGSS